VRPGKTPSILTPEQIENAKLISVSYLIKKQMEHDDATTTLRDAQIDPEMTLDAFNLRGWGVADALSTKNYLVLGKGQQTKIVFRGADGQTNEADNAHVKATMKGQPRNYDELDELIQHILRQRDPNQIQIVSYSNGAPKGQYISDKYGIAHQTIDPLFGPSETKALINRSANAPSLEIIKTTRIGVTSPALTAAQVALGSDPINTKVIQIQPLEKGGSGGLLTNFKQDHDIETYSHTTSTGGKSQFESKVSGGKNFAGGLAAGLIPGTIATLAVQGIAPNQSQQAKIAEIATGTSVLGKGVSPLVGAGAAGIGETILPIYASMEAGEGVNNLLDTSLPTNMDPVLREAIKGTGSGGVGGATFGATQVAQRVVEQAVSQGATQLTTSTTAGEAGIEMGAIGASTAAETTAAALGVTEGVEMVAAGAAAATTVEEISLGSAALAGAALGGSGLAELGPLALAGAVVGAGVGVASALITQALKQDGNSRQEHVITGVSHSEQHVQELNERQRVERQAEHDEMMATHSEAAPPQVLPGDAQFFAEAEAESGGRYAEENSHDLSNYTNSNQMSYDRHFDEKQGTNSSNDFSQFKP